MSEIRAHALTPVSDEHAFHFADGRRARDLREFRAILAEADPGLVDHHREHYHYWLADIARDLTLARKIQALGEKPDLPADDLRATLVKTVDARLTAYRKNKAPGKPRKKTAAKKPSRTAGASRKAQAQRKPAAKKKASAPAKRAKASSKRRKR